MCSVGCLFSMCFVVFHLRGFCNFRKTNNTEMGLSTFVCVAKTVPPPPRANVCMVRGKGNTSGNNLTGCRRKGCGGCACGYPTRTRSSPVEPGKRAGEFGTRVLGRARTSSGKFNKLKCLPFVFQVVLKGGFFPNPLGFWNFPPLVCLLISRVCVCV